MCEENRKCFRNHWNFLRMWFCGWNLLRFPILQTLRFVIKSQFRAQCFFITMFLILLDIQHLSVSSFFHSRTQKHKLIPTRKKWDEKAYSELYFSLLMNFNFLLDAWIKVSYAKRELKNILVRLMKLLKKQSSNNFYEKVETNNVNVVRTTIWVFYIPVSGNPCAARILWGAAKIFRNVLFF